MTSRANRRSRHSSRLPIHRHSREGALLMVVFFSGTGNSEYCARYIARSIGDNVIDSAQYIRNKQIAQLESQKPWVFVTPTYAWQIPKVFKSFVRQSSLSGNKNAYFVLTCGGSVGGAASGGLSLCKEKGLRFKGLKGIVMPENLITMFKAPESDEAERIIEKAVPEIEKAAQVIKSGKAFEKQKYSFLSFLQSDLSNPLFYKAAVSAKKFYATDECIGCGICAQKCVMGNITMQDGKPRWDNNCTQCMACIAYCPKQAIEYGKATKGKTRYRCKELE